MTDLGYYREVTEKFIKESFSPVIAVLTSYEAELICQKNNLSFCELLAPFNQLPSEAALKDPSNQSHLIKSLRLDFRDLRRDGFLATNALPLALTELVGVVPVHVDVPAVQSGGESEHPQSPPQITPWYDQYRKQFTKLFEPSEHEFIRNYIACLLVVSTSHADPLDQLTRLSQTQHVFQHQSGQAVNTGRSVSSELLHLPKHAAQPKWFSPNIFKFHLLLHDVSTDDEKKAETTYQSMKMTYGAHACHLLRINSNSNSVDDCATFAPDPWACYLKRNLRHFDSIRIVTPLVDDRNTNNTDRFPLETTPMVDFTTSVVDAMLGNSHNSIIDGDTEAWNGPSSEVTDSRPAKVVRSESIPHPLSSNDLTKLEDCESSRIFGRNGQADINIREEQTRHGKYLSSTDIDRIKIFVQEFCLRGLLPFVERQLKLLNDQISSRRSLISKSLVTSAKRWFTSGSSPNLPAVAAAASTTASSPDKAPPGGNFRPQQQAAYPIYTPESVEMQMRRLADMAFLFQHYELAYQHYYALKKEFAHTGAWLHQAGTAEFASLCVYLSSSSTTNYPNHYIDSALTTYASVCGKPWLAIRATMFGAEILISQNTPGSFSEAAGLYIRMTTGDDLSGALFLERAAWCFAKAKLFRKAALHLILAGHRYRKAGLNRHTIRCYELAYVAYEFRSWRFAEDHIRFTLNNHQLKNTDDTGDVVDDYASLLAKFPKLVGYCFSSEYLSATGRWAEALVSASARKPLPSALTGRQDYVYAPAVSAQTVRDTRHGNVSDRIVIGESNAYSDLVSCRLNCQSTLTHDFSSSSLCYVPVQLSLFNRHASRHAKLTLKFFGGSQNYSDTVGSPKTSYQQQICQPLCWTRYSIESISLKPNDSKTIGLSGYCAIPGVYDASSLRIAYRLPDDEQRDNGELEAKLPSHFVTIRQADQR